MKIAYVDGFRLYSAFWAGTSEMEKIRADLDSINVYPVPDGDTGSNMASTLRSAVSLVRPERHLGRTFLALAEASLVGARGNSGLILAQYFLGAARALEEFHRADTYALANALGKAAAYAATAVSRPVEGTILTVMRAWTERMGYLAAGVADFSALLAESLPEARKALLDTPNRLPVLARAGVLDAGGKGFLAFLEGIHAFIERGNLKLVKPAPLPEIETPSHAGPDLGVPEFRYCTEAMLSGEKAQPGELSAFLGGWGDSVIVGGFPGKVRIHLHTNEPARVFSGLEAYGTATHQKAEDMLRQVQVLNNRKGSVALVTDSSCDLPQDLLDAHQVHVVPLKLNIGGSEYLDRLTMTAEEFYRHVENGRGVTTSQPSVKEFERLYEFLSSHYESILSIHLSSALSGTWGAAKKAAESLPSRRIEVVDSRHLCASLGLVVLRAAEALEAGTPLLETVRLVEKWSGRARILVSLKTVDYMVKGGRIGPVRGALARLMGLKPVISVDAEGRGTAVGKARSGRANLDRIRFLAEEVHSSEGLWGYAVAHAHAPGEAEAWAGEMERSLGFGPRFIVDISPVIGLNSGPGSLALAFLPAGQ